MRTILIIADPADPHALAVQSHLTDMGCKVAIWQTRHLLQEQKLVYTFGERSTADLLLNQGNPSSLDLHSVDAVWMRRFGQVKAGPALESWIESVVERESTRAVKSLLRNLSCFKVNDPEKQDECLYKLTQLKAAKESGFEIPKSVVTNSPDAVRDFIDNQRGNVIYKLIDEGTTALLPFHRNPSAIFTTEVEASDLAEIDSVANSLHLFQEKIDKLYDVRLTVIGGNIFGVKIASRAGRGSVDFRLDYSVPIENFVVPPEVEAATQKLMNRLGLVFGCVDLAVDNAGLVYFFEINPQGQFLWIEDAVRHPLSFELAKLLKKAEL